MTSLALFLSGTGGNALNLVQACREGRIPGRPVLAVSSRATALGNARLAAEGVPVEVLAQSAHGSDEAFSNACFQAVDAAGAEVIALCGWLKKLVIPPAWEGRILNIHPSLLPAFGGPGMYGMHVHRAVVAAGVPETGCTIHLVDQLYDHGPILAQARVPVLSGDTPEAVQQRVYAEELRLYPQALATYLERLRAS